MWSSLHHHYRSHSDYTDEWLEEQNAREAVPRSWKGKEYTAYEATQKQRQMETTLRARREQVQLLKTGGADEENIVLAQCKYQALLDDYKSFSSFMGLPVQTERIYTGRTKGRIAPSAKVYAEWKAKTSK